MNERRPIAAVKDPTYDTGFWVICEDGSMWYHGLGGQWFENPPIPGTLRDATPLVLRDPPGPLTDPQDEPEPTARDIEDIEDEISDGWEDPSEDRAWALAYLDTHLQELQEIEEAAALVEAEGQHVPEVKEVVQGIRNGFQRLVEIRKDLWLKEMEARYDVEEDEDVDLEGFQEAELEGEGEESS